MRLGMRFGVRRGFTIWPITLVEDMGIFAPDGGRFWVAYRDALPEQYLEETQMLVTETELRPLADPSVMGDAAVVDLDLPVPPPKRRRRKPARA